MAQRTDSTERTYTVGLCRRNALHVLKLAWTTHPGIAFDHAGVRWLFSYIEVSQQHLPDDMAEEFVQLFGCFYGECLLAAFGGTWEWRGDRLAIHMVEHGYTYPFTAVAKQLALGEEASVAVAYEAAVNFHATVAA